MDAYWKCDGKTLSHDGHPAVYLPINEKYPYCGNSKDTEQKYGESMRDDLPGDQ